MALHQWGTREVEPGFLCLPDAKNISVVIANANATDLDPNASVPKLFVAEERLPDYHNPNTFPRFLLSSAITFDNTISNFLILFLLAAIPVDDHHCSQHSVHAL